MYQIIFSLLALVLLCGCDVKPDAGAMAPKAVNACAAIGASHSGESLTVSIVIGDDLEGVVMAQTKAGSYSQVSGGALFQISGASATVGACEAICAGADKPAVVPEGAQCLRATLPSAHACLKGLKGICGVVK